MRLITGKIFFLFCAVGLFIACNDSQNKKTGDQKITGSKVNHTLPKSSDSLIALLKITSSDTEKINILGSLGWKMMSANIDSSIILDSEALVLSKKIINSNDSVEARAGKMGIAVSFSHLGTYHWQKSNFSLALDEDRQSLKIYTELNNKKGIFTDLNNMGLVYNSEGSYSDALDYFFRSLHIADELADQKSEATNLGNIGLVYRNLTEFPKALDYYLRALKISESQKNESSMAKWYGNIGSIYNDEHDFSKALEYYLKALKIDKARQNKTGIAIRLGSIGNVFEWKAELESGDSAANDFKSAREYYLESLGIFQSMGNKLQASAALGELGVCDMKTGKYKEAFDYLSSAFNLSENLGAKDFAKEACNGLSELYEKSNIPLPDSAGKMLDAEQMRLYSLSYFQRYINLRDSIFSEQNQKQLVQKEMNYEFEKKTAKEKSEQDKKDALGKEELKQREKQRNYFIAGFVLVLALAGFIFRSYRQKQKANEIISEQKLIVEEKQKEILDSIHYAKRIQQAILPTQLYIEKSLIKLKSKTGK